LQINLSHLSTALEMGTVVGFDNNTDNDNDDHHHDKDAAIALYHQQGVDDINSILINANTDTLKQENYDISNTTNDDQSFIHPIEVGNNIYCPDKFLSPFQQQQQQ
jgi:hypothetical protein